MMTENPVNNSDKTKDTRPLEPNGERIEQWKKIKPLFERAAGLSRDAREAFLDEAVGDDRDLKNEVLALLAAYEDADTFLEGHAVEEAASFFENRVGAFTTGTGQRNFVAGTIVGGRYRIIGLIGKGGMGEVYKAEDVKLSQIVALKFLPDHLANNVAALARFHSEVRTARQVSHTNVCRVFDIGEVDGQHFLSMEFIDGDDLSSLLRRIGRLPSERAVEIARQLCVGLSAIHQAGILHRDLKPANVIIDSNGKVRITDFGIAGIAGDAAEDENRVGTPAYMSPEQISGKGVSVKSDIYSLGLVLYEIFTGKQAFRADTIPDLIRKHQFETPTNPSEFVKGIDPLVESVIAQCLEKKPADRPGSALHVAMALPGGNPMQVALDAGETPSPEMVAASPRKGAITILTALTCVVASVFLIALGIYAASYTSPHNHIPFNKSPEVLSERANEIVQKLGYTDEPHERAYRIEVDRAYLDVMRSSDTETRRKFDVGRDLSLYFSERQTPRNFEILQAGNGFWLYDGQSRSGERTISLDTRGRLLEFIAVPPEKSLTAVTATDFGVAFQAAGLDLGAFGEVEPNWTPAVAFDERKAWQGAMPDHPETPLRVEAASFQGRIVYFRQIYPWSATSSSDSVTNPPFDWLGALLFAAVLVGIIVIAVFLAWTNVRSGSGDLRGAFKLAIVVFFLVLFGWLFSMNHVAAFSPEVDRLLIATRVGLMFSIATLLAYLALEPIIRRNMPELIVSWNRLLAGDWRDPLVGRDVLVGTLCGVAEFALRSFAHFIELRSEGATNAGFYANALISLRSWWSVILSTSGFGFGLAFLQICIFAVAFLFSRRRGYALAVIFVLLVLIPGLLFSHSVISLVLLALSGIMWCWLIYRVGLVGMTIAQCVAIWFGATLLTMDFSAWHAHGMFLTLALIGCVLAFGFRYSIAGQTWSGLPRPGQA